MAEVFSKREYQSEGDHNAAYTANAAQILEVLIGEEKLYLIDN
jgi:hypothetical protein